MLPIDLVLVRHGHSEGNKARELSDNGDDSLFTEQFMERHSSMFRLTDVGRAQPPKAGLWIKQNISAHFDRYETSTYLRAMETAHGLDLPDAQWRIVDYLRERDMADWDNLPEGMKKKDYAKSYARYKKDPYRWQPPGGGEAMPGLCIRADRVLETYRRDCPDQKVIAVLHGMLMWAIMIRIEGLTPWQYLKIRKQKKVPYLQINNCQVIHYTRRNPETGRLSPKIQWVRSVCPWDLEHSDPSWRLITRLRYSNDDLRAIVELTPRIHA